MVSADSTGLLSCGARLGAVCASSRAGREHTLQAGEVLQPQPSLLGSRTLSAALCLLSIGQQTPAGCYSRMFTLFNLFIDCIPGPASSCFSRASPQGRDRNALHCTGWFSKWNPWAPPFHSLIYLCTSSVPIFCIDLLLRL